MEMRKSFNTMLFAVMAMGTAHAQGLSQPYLQTMTPTSVDVMFQTDKARHCWVEYGTDSLATKRARTILDGQEVCFDIENRIKLSDLQPATRYYYRVCAVELKVREAYDVQYGDTLRTPFHPFTTPSDKDGDFTCIIFNDLHEHNETYEYLRQRANAELGAEAPSFVVFNGDCLPEPRDRQHAMKMIHTLADPMNGAETPIIFLRGNHEIRNAYSAGMHSLIGYYGDKTYAAFTWGGTRFVMLDCGEDKPDDHQEYFGLNDFTQLRLDQVEFLKKELSGKPFKKAQRRVLISHIPVFGCSDKYKPCLEMWGPMLASQPFDVALGAHNHRPEFHPEGIEGCRFPLFIGGGPQPERATVAILKKRGKELRLKVLSKNKDLEFEKVL